MGDRVENAQDEIGRLAALHALRILDTASLPHLDAVCRLAADLFDAPHALLIMVDEARVWCKASAGEQRPSDLPRADAVCHHTIMSLDGEPLIAPDLTLDPRFSCSSLVTGPLQARFYAGAPIALRLGVYIGTLCVIDIAPRAGFSPKQVRQLTDLAVVVTEHLRLHEAQLREEAELEQRHRIEAALIERDGRLREAVASQRMAEQIAGFGQWRIDIVTETVMWSEGVCRIHGKDGARVLTMSLAEHLACYHPEDRERVSARFLSQTFTSSPEQTDYDHCSRVIRPDGEVRTINVRGVIERDGAGAAVAIHGICFDVTDHARSEAELLRTTGFLRATLEAIDQGLVMVGPDGRVEVHNRHARELLALGDDALLDGTSFAEIGGALIGEADLGLDPRHQELTRPDGRTIEARAAALAGGGVVHTFTDVTARRIAEQSLRASETSYRQLADALPLIVCTLRDDGATTYVNEEFRRFFGKAGLTRTEQIAAIHPDDLARCRIQSEAANAWGQSAECEARLLDRLGAYRWHKLSLRRIERDDAMSVWLVTALDIDDIVTARESLEATTALLRLAQDAAGAGVWDLDLGTGVCWQSPESARLQGLPLDPDDPAKGLHLTFEDWERAVPEADRALIRNKIEQAAASRTTYECEFRITTPSGEERWLHGFGRVEFEPGAGRPHRIVGMNLDITPRKAAEAASRATKAKLLASEERLALALDSGSDGLWDTNRQTGETWFSDRLLSMLGYGPGELDCGAGVWGRLTHPDDAPRATQLMRDHIEGRSAGYESEHRMITKTSEVVWVLARGKVVARDAQGVAQRVVGTHIDITERKAAERRVAHLASHDVLTDLPNRALFRERLEATLEELRRTGGKAAVLCLDLDRFKAINDTLGHVAGDTLLQVVARRLKAGIREGDTVARLGGDEFAIILGHVEEPAAAAAAQRMIEAVGEALDLNGRTANVGLSIGIALAPADGSDADALMRHADLALYRAKGGGRNIHRFYEAGMDTAIEFRTQLEFDMREAVLRNEMTLSYQPAVGLRDEAVVGCEALMRWTHPTRGPISPVDFIPLAEETGLIVPLGDWVLREACREAASWPRALGIAVNVSAAQFQKAGLEQSILRALAASGLAPHRLELEITESVLIQDTDAVIGCLHRLRQIGVRIALDDFGTGYSSLSYLRQFPFDKIKIDHSFIREIANPDTAAIVRAIVGLGERLGITITAEGVETEAQLDLVRREGCNEVQGYYYGKPMSPQELRAFLARYVEGVRAA